MGVADKMDAMLCLLVALYLPSVDLDGVEWGSIAEWVGGLGGAGALLLTYRLLKHEIEARRSDRREAADARQREVAGRLYAEVKGVQLDLPHPDATSPPRLAQLARQVELSRFEVTDETLRQRLHITATVAAMLGKTDDVFANTSGRERASRGAAIDPFMQLLACMALSLEHYINGEALPPWWDSLPQHPGKVAAWTWAAGVEPKGSGS